MTSTPIYKIKAEFFKTSGHPARIRILEVLREGEHSVSDLVPEVGLEASHLSQQLAVLRRANLVQTRKEGTSVVYSVTNQMIFELTRCRSQDSDVVTGRHPCPVEGT